MDYRIEPMFPFKLIGFIREFNNDSSYDDIPKFWDKFCEQYAMNVYAGNPPISPLEKAIVDNCIGEYGVCIDNLDNGKLKYLIAGRYLGGDIPEGMTLYEFPEYEWAVFDCTGPIPESIQTLNTKIFKEWLFENKEFELAANASIEWYDYINGEKTDPDYKSAVWIPIKRKTGLLLRIY